MRSALRKSAGCQHHRAARQQGAAGRPAAAAAMRAAPQQTPRRCPLVSTAAAVDPDNASILVCGGGGVGLAVTRKLKDMGSWVWMMQRHDDRRQEIEGMMAIVAKADALDKDAVNKVFNDIEEIDAVVSTLGGSTKNPKVDSQGNINVIEAALAKGVKKFILVTSIGCGETKDAPGEQVYKVLEPVLLEKNKAEDKLKSVGDKMSFTIIRPGGLKTDPATGNAVATENTTVCGAVTRDDVAAVVIQALLSDKADNKVLSVIDSEMVFGEPSYETFKFK